MMNGRCYIERHAFQADVFIWGDIEEISVYKELVELLQKLDSKHTITLYINSWGGVFTTAITLFKEILLSEAKIITVIDMAASAAALLALAGDEIRYTKLSTLMLHYLKRDGEVSFDRDAHERDMLLSIFECIFEEKFAQTVFNRLEEKGEIWYSGYEITTDLIPNLNKKERNEKLQYSSVSTNRSS